MSSGPRMVRQGDILLLPASAEAKTAAHVERPRDDGAVVLARGEQTGHTHAIYEEKVHLYATARATDDAVLVVEEGRRKLAIDEVLREPNVELRRALIELYGLARWTRELGEPVAEDACGKLWSLRIDGQAVTFVEVVNSTPEPDGTRKTYFLRVPPWMRSARQAVAWTFGLDASDYDPAIES